MEEFLQKIADYEWDLTVVWAALLETVSYWAETLGPVAYLFVALIVIFIGLSLDLTHHTTSLLVAGILKGVVYFFLTILLGVLAVSARLLGSTLVARWRDVVVFSRNRYKFAKIAGENKE